MSNFGLGEMLFLAVFGLLIFGPDQLPKIAADAARMLRQVRTMASGARRELTEALGPELTDMQELKDLQNLNPRTFVKRNLFDLIDEDPDTAAPAVDQSDEAQSRRADNRSLPKSDKGYDSDTL